MKNFYTLIVLVLLLIKDVAFGQTMIKRASLSTSVAVAHNIQFVNYKVQQSIGHMGITGSIKNQNRTVLRGFLLPQSAATTSTPTLDFNLSFYPNPFVDYVELSFDTPVTGDMAARLHDVTGQLIIVEDAGGLACLSATQLGIYTGTGAPTGTNPTTTPEAGDVYVDETTGTVTLDTTNFPVFAGDVIEIHYLN